MCTECRGYTCVAVSLLAMVLIATTPALAGSLTEELTRSVQESKVNLGFRYRFEAVDDDAFVNNASWASTLRSRLTVALKPVRAFGLLLEVDDVRHIGAENFNDSRNGVTDRPTVIDPKGTDLNQALLRYTGFAGTELAIGRQRIERNNQRFVGGVGWRQNEQTFDSASISHRFNENLSASYAFIDRVNRIQGPYKGTPPADLDSDTHLMDASYVFGSTVNLAGYWYLMDLENSDALSNQVLGIRATGGLPLANNLKFNYVAEFARQDDYADNPVDYSASYYLLEVGVAAARIGLKAGYEVLEGDRTPGSAFRTPLATLHAFQGWVDKFLVTPDAGIVDLYVVATGKALGADLTLRVHDFSADAGSADWGSELDFSANWPIGTHYSMLLAGATYDADDLYSDTNKYWLMLTAAFCDHSDR